MEDKDKIIHISYSEFSKYMECGHRHLIEKYLKIVPDPISIHLVFGNSIHSTIEFGIKNKVGLDERISFFREDFYKNMMNKLKNSPEFNFYDEFLEQGVSILKKLPLDKLFNKYELLGVEVDLYEPLFGIFRFKGFIDLVLRNLTTQKILIIDWKTSTEAWDVNKKKQDKIFMSQMRFYKFFYARKLNIDYDQIDCKYVVLNRLKSKNAKELGFGDIQTVEMSSEFNDIEQSIELLAETVKNIHIDNVFNKAKLNGKKDKCFFCPHKNSPALCNNNPEQYRELIFKHLS